LAALATASCSLVVDGDDRQCAEDADCAAAGPSFARWRCVDRLCHAPQPDAGVPLPDGFGCLDEIAMPSPGPVERTMAFLDYLTDSPVTQGEAKICDAYDVDCATPLQQNLRPDAQGVITYTVDRTFSGYLEMRVPDRFPTLVWINPFYIRGPETRGRDPVPVLSEAMFEAMAGLMGVSVDPATGHIVGVAVDCAGSPAAGMTAEIDVTVGEVPYFFYVSSAGFPINAEETDGSGRFGGFNITPGIGESVTRVSQRFVGKSALIVRAAQVTIVTVFPSPP
jgi:hypothetical protein